MDTAQIASLLQPFLREPLSALQLDQISTYIELLLRWNQRINLTAVRDEISIVKRHFGESLFAAQTLLPRDNRLNLAAPHNEENIVTRYIDDSPPSAQTVLQDNKAQTLLPRADPPRPLTVLDVGSGPGFPGIPIKLWASNVSLTLIESTQKKATFLREVIRTLALAGASVFANRAEEYPRASADLVTLRAVERFTSILPVAAALVAPKGRLALLIGAAENDLTPSLEKNFQWHDLLRIPLSSSRFLRVGERK